jgi:hypothetical protein
MGKEEGLNLDFFSVRPSDHNPTCIISSRGEALQQRLFLSELDVQSAPAPLISSRHPELQQPGCPTENALLTLENEPAAAALNDPVPDQQRAGIASASLIWFLDILLAAEDR